MSAPRGPLRRHRSAQQARGPRPRTQSAGRRCDRTGTAWPRSGRAPTGASGACRQEFAAATRPPRNSEERCCGERPRPLGARFGEPRTRAPAGICIGWRRRRLKSRSRNCQTPAAGAPVTSGSLSHRVPHHRCPNSTETPCSPASWSWSWAWWWPASWSWASWSWASWSSTSCWSRWSSTTRSR